MFEIRGKSVGKIKSRRILVVLLVPAVALILAGTVSEGWAGGEFWGEGEEGLDESAVFFEFNSTDCDVGIQFFWDGVAWKWMIVKDQHGRAVLDIFPLQNVRAVGLTEGRFEGDEPQLIEDSECDLADNNILEAIEDFIKQYKEGPYTFKGMAVEERRLLLGDAELTYDILKPAEFTDTTLPNISWNSPAGFLFDDGEDGTPEVLGYEMVVELVVMENGDERVFKETTTLPGDATSYMVSDTFMALIAGFAGDIVELKIEVLADEESGNRTITEKVLVEPAE